jgi:serine O-acetyltransferase
MKAMRNIVDEHTVRCGEKTLVFRKETIQGFADLVSAIVESYEAEAITRYIDGGCLPSHAVIIEIIRLLRELLFPGYFGRQGLVSGTIAYHVGELLDDIRDKLQAQLHNALRHEAMRRCGSAEGIENRAEEISYSFLGTIPRLRAMLATDIQAAFNGDPAASNTDEIIFSYPGFTAITVYRMAHELYIMKVPLIPRIMTEYAHSITGIDIHPGSVIGDHFFIDHGTGVVIGETAVIGNNVKIYQGVTLGALSTRAGQRLRGVKRHPTLEDRVTVYSGTSILGGETIIGAGAVIGGNVFITKSVPAGTRVSVKSPELQYRDHMPQEFTQEPPDWVI